MEARNIIGNTELTLGIRVIIDTLLGALMGLEREWHGKDAGIRTHAAVSLGACVFGIISFSAANAPDPTRIAAQVVAGIGFLGAGVILRDRNHVKGLTTAAVLWISAAVGLSVAYGLFFLGGITALLSVLLLFIPHWRKQSQS